MVSALFLADAVPPALESFGRTHPLVIHLPLGLVVAAFLVEATRVLQRRATVSAFTPTALGLAALGAVVSCVTGWFFAESEGSGGDLFWHRWLGIATAVALVAVAWMAARAAQPDTDRGAQVTPVLRGSLLAVTALVAWVGHLGGNMVWGPNYALEPFTRSAAKGDAGTGAKGKDGEGSKATAAGEVPPGLSTGASEPDAMTFYTSKVLPLVQDRCYECHGNGKHKGGLKLDERASVVGRNSDGVAITVPGDPAHSLLIERCLLPAADDEAMPPKGDRLKASELDVLRRWIEDGVTMPESPVAAGRGADVDVKRVDAPLAPTAPQVTSGLPALSQKEIAEGASLRARGINAVPVSVGASTFSVSLPGGKQVDDADFSAIFPIAGRIEELSLARSAVTDAAMMQMPAMPVARSVRLDNTGLTDIGIIAVLSRTLEAESVNLVSTGATDAVFAMLAKLPNLKRAYVFDTKITAQGIDEFRARRPGVQIVVGQAVPGTSGTAGPPVGP
ncbi:MAG: hypothetical protein EBU31_06480 [Proteobacteria bacterium]|nr:hypothetical protein [Pseudomonadota bacterium]